MAPILIDSFRQRSRFISTMNKTALNIRPV